MLVGLHVKNIALIEEADVEFGEGLNVLTGETGAGKSLLLGSVNLALGAKLSANVIRHGASSALVELIFSLDNDESAKALADAGYEPYEGSVVITRKITDKKSIFRINGETCTAMAVKQIAGTLLDIHGQHDHQSLLYRDRQLSILDEYAGSDVKEIKTAAAREYDDYQSLKHELSKYSIDEDARLREIEFLQFEADEIENAAIGEDEEEQLTAQYRKISSARNIISSLSDVYKLTGYENGAGELIGRAIKEISGVAGLDEELSQINSSLLDAESLLSDINRAAMSYIDDFTFSDEEFETCEKRLDLIHHLQAKYGRTTADIYAYLEKNKERLEFLSDYADRKTALEKELAALEEQLKGIYKKLSGKRKEHAEKLKEGIISELKELNFPDVRFDISFSEKEGFHKDGTDDVEFMIAANPGEPMLPLSKVASGGELSRIMLAIKTILSKNDPVETLIFDEIDTGISGRTAAKVAEKLKKISKGHQVLCITHLAQIAAMADNHFVIDKTVENGETFTNIHKLDSEESLEELARILGGSVITDAVRNNAKELRELALKI